MYLSPKRPNRVLAENRNDGCNAIVTTSTPARADWTRGGGDFGRRRGVAVENATRKKTDPPRAARSVGVGSLPGRHVEDAGTKRIKLSEKKNKNKSAGSCECRFFFPRATTYKFIGHSVCRATGRPHWEFACRAKRPSERLVFARYIRVIVCACEREWERFADRQQCPSAGYRHRRAGTPTWARYLGGRSLGRFLVVSQIRLAIRGDSRLWKMTLPHRLFVRRQIRTPLKEGERFSRLVRIYRKIRQR